MTTKQGKTSPKSNRAAQSRAGKTGAMRQAGKQRLAGRTSGDPAADQSSSPKRPSKLDRIVALLARPEGASLAELVATTGWQPHSVRGALAGTLKRKGHMICSEKVEGERRYRTGETQ